MNIETRIKKLEARIKKPDNDGPIKFYVTFDEDMNLDVLFRGNPEGRKKYEEEQRELEQARKNGERIKTIVIDGDEDE